MIKLQSIDSFPSDAIDLLQAVGYMDTQELCESNTQELVAELIKANEALGILSVAPTVDLLESWKEIARAAMGASGDSEAAAPDVETSVPAVGFSGAESIDALSVRSCEGSTKITILAGSVEGDDVQLLLKKAPTADPIPAELIRQNNLSVRDIAEGVLLSDCASDVVVNVKSESSKKEMPPQKTPPQKTEPKRSTLMTSRVRSFTEAEEEEHHVKPLERGEQRDVVSLSKGLNAGLSPDSRRFVRGVLHPEPLRVRVSAFFAVLVQFFLVLAFLAIPAVIICDQFYEVPNVIWWLAGVMTCLLLSTICYLIWGLAARCRVCGQRQFAPKKCLKNRKAHHIALIGYIFPTALHAMFYKWFYCTYCGTAVRLKK